MEVERASLSDAEEILALQKLAYRSEAEIYGDWTIEPLVQTLEELRRQFEDHVVLKAVASGAIVGSVRASARDGTCRIGKLMVHPDRRKQGIGRSLMNAIEAYFPGCRYELFTGSRSVRNIALYEKLGYAVFRERAASPDVTLVYMEKKNG
ncbi:GNAT family N-acetyltransferase [Cohnella xylanilytica]|uniref:GNAT family N-acetyltransferase n=2 Tax=Cohnella xylanilytica TaxID=557555 RepID=A0A841TR96_9BACL|nr:GNAT family N-acetyltransferase [Cohnella xylanilytica]